MQSISSLFYTRFTNHGLVCVQWCPANVSSAPQSHDSIATAVLAQSACQVNIRLLCGCVVQVNVTAAMGMERAESPPLVVFHPCHLCGLTYTSAIMLSNHLASMHGGEKNVLCCKVQSVGMGGTYRDVLKHCVSFLRSDDVGNTALACSVQGRSLFSRAISFENKKTLLSTSRLLHGTQFRQEMYWRAKAECLSWVCRIWLSLSYPFAGVEQLAIKQFQGVHLRWTITF